MDLKAIADGIAARFAGVTTSASETLTSAPTASLPNTVGKGPVCLVYPPVGVLDIGVSKLRRDEYDFAVRILFDPLDVPSRTDRLYRWQNATRDLVEANMDLDLAYVSWARPISSRAELDGQKYGDAVFDVIEYIVRVHVQEVVTTLAV